MDTSFPVFRSAVTSSRELGKQCRSDWFYKKLKKKKKKKINPPC